MAGSVLACAVGSLPFAGGGADHLDAVTTIDGAASVAPAPPTATPPDLIEVVPTTAPLVAAPPVEVAPPPPPPPPEGVELDPSHGAVFGGKAPTDEPVLGVNPAATTPARAPSVVDDAHAPERVWAVVVGVDDYPGTASDLRAATADARDLLAALNGYGVPDDHVVALLDRAATAQAVLGAVEWLVANAGPEDTAVFFFAGHVRDLGGGTEAMVTADAGWLTDWFLADRFQGLGARDAWFVVAGCYGGGFDELLGPGRVLTAGAGPGELAYENDEYGRSYLAEFVVRRGLLAGAAGAPTVQAAVAYAARELAALHPNRQLWHRDQAGHVISLDGRRRDGSAMSTQPQAPPTTQPPTMLEALIEEDCVFGLLGTCR